MADSDDFIQLCKALRRLGATKVEGFGYAAEFEERRVRPVPQASAPVALMAPARVRHSASSAAGTVPDRLTPERLAELREEQYARELGR